MRGIGQASRRPPRGKGAPPKAVKQVIINAAWYKPDGRHLTETVGRLAASEGRAPAATVMLGDSRNDLLAARDAGLPVILVSHGYGAEPAASLGADRLIDHFDRLPAALGALLRA